MLADVWGFSAGEVSALNITHPIMRRKSIPS